MHAKNGRKSVVTESAFNRRIFEGGQTAPLNTRGMTSAEHVENNYEVKKSCSYLKYVHHRPLCVSIFVLFKTFKKGINVFKIIKTLYAHTNITPKMSQILCKFFEMQIYSNELSIQLNH